EFPTDQRGSTFRQFWEPVGVNTRALQADAWADSVRDIKKIHEWPAASQLGDHGRIPNDHRPRVVLVIRGELLRRYPNTIIYAQRATWGTGAEQNLLVLHDPTGAKALASIAGPDFSFPIFRAQVEPDISFIGFDLLLGDVRGDPTLREDEASRLRLPADQ